MTANPVQIQSSQHTGYRAADFVGRTQGKLRDHYRIGKVLGTGKLSSCYFNIDNGDDERDLFSAATTNVNHLLLYRRVR